MVDFTNLAQAAALQQQVQQVTQAIDHLDGGGLVVSLTIGPPPEAVETGPGMMAATVWLVADAPTLIAEVRKALVSHEEKLGTDLNNIGIVVPAR